MAAPVAGLLLAAGRGRRFGGPKALAELGGRSLVERGVRLLARAGLDPVMVVCGAAASEVRRRARDAGADVVVNRAWASGMGSSLRAGLESLEGRAGAVVVALVDQPAVGAGAIERLVEAWRGGARAAVATYNGAWRNPVLLDAAVWPEVAALARGDRGARAWLRAHPDQVVAVPCDGTGSAADVDTRAELERLARGERRWS